MCLSRISTLRMDHEVAIQAQKIEDSNHSRFAVAFTSGDLELAKAEVQHLPDYEKGRLLLEIAKFHQDAASLKEARILLKLKD